MERGERQALEHLTALQPELPYLVEWNDSKVTVNTCHIGPPHCLVLDVEFIKDEHIQTVSNPIVIVNPPMDTPDEAGDIFHNQEPHIHDALKSLEVILMDHFGR